MHDRDEGHDETVPRALLRVLLDEVLVTDGDLDAFALDYFPRIKRQWTDGMERVRKLNLLLERGAPADILRQLRQTYPQEVTARLAALGRPDLDPAVAGPLAWSQRVPLYLQGFDAPAQNSQDYPCGEPWFIGERSGWHATIEAGIYRLRNSTQADAAYYLHLAVADPAGDPLDLSCAPVSVKIRISADGATPLSGAGILYRFDRRSRDYLAFTIDGAGRLSVWRRARGNIGRVASEVCAAVRPHAWNTLGLAGQGDGVTLFVNGSQVKTLRGDLPLHGEPGVFAISTGSFEFDDFTLHDGSTAAKAG